MFKPVEPKVSFPKLEQEVLDFWQQNDIFRRSVEERPEDRMFIFYEGPPTANARPGIHHVLSRVFKDLIPRYKTMQGYRVPRKGGWDTHGLPVELEVEKELGLKSKPEIEQYGIEAFNAKCKESVSRYVEEWTRLTERIGFWVDFDNPYVTYAQRLHRELLVDLQAAVGPRPGLPGLPRHAPLPALRHVPERPRGRLGYEDDTPDPSVFVKFRVPSSEGSRAARPCARSDVVCSSRGRRRPWTLPGNTALAVNADADYGVYERRAVSGWCVAQALAAKVLGEGHEPVGARSAAQTSSASSYEPLYRPEHSGRPRHAVRRRTAACRARRRTSPSTDGLRRVIAADYVSLDDGSGIVHIAPAFGARGLRRGQGARPALRAAGRPPRPHGRRACPAPASS